MEQYLKSWSENLFKNEQALDYLASRGVSEYQIDRFKIGWSARQVKISKENKIYYGGFSDTGYLLFPLTKIDSKPVGFISKAVSHKAYYKWFREYSGAHFFGLDQEVLQEIWRTGEVYLVEGSFDFFPLHRIYPNTLCLTSANVSDHQYLFLERFVKKAYIYLDNDLAGKRASKKMSDNISSSRLGKIHGLSCNLLTLPFKDIGQAWEEWGDDKLRKYILDQTTKFIV